MTHTGSTINQDHWELAQKDFGCSSPEPAVYQLRFAGEMPMGGKLRSFLSTPYIAAYVLLCAAFAKSWSAVQGRDLDAIAVFILGIEFLLGTWLLTRWRADGARVAAAALFAAFTVVAIVRLAQGAERCNCFGSVTLNAWVMLIVSLALFSALAIDRLGAWRAVVPSHLSTPVAAAGLLTAFVNFAIFVITGPNDPYRVGAWAARAIDSLAATSTLPSGNWEIYVVQHSCDSCREFLRSLETRVASAPDDSIFLVAELPPYADAITRKVLFPRNVNVVRLPFTSCTVSSDGDSLSRSKPARSEMHN